ncbi:hypothetical protein FRC03_012227 [Tulasnella sp. 419]|nr:hypothetical protein FRC03_012227 [Tulasnella sp. 419]
MRCEHTPHSLPAFPVYSLGFVDDEKLVLGGGGGAGRSGIKNKLRLYRSKGKELELVHELQLEQNEDAPMTMAVHPEASEIVCGINSAEEKVKAGENQNCRIYSLEKDEIKLVKSTQTLLPDPQSDDYQKVTTFSPLYDLLAVGSTNNQVSLLSYPSLSPAAPPFDIPKDGGDLFDLDFLDHYLMVTGSKAIYVLETPTSKGSAERGSKEKKSKKKTSSEKPSGSLVIQQKLPVPALPGVASGVTSTFRSVRSVTTKDGDLISTTVFGIINTTPPRTASKGAARKAFVCSWEVQKNSSDAPEWKLRKTRAISNKAVTVFDVSRNGKLLAFGSSDLSIGILDSRSLAPLLTILNAHEFPPTTLRFSPNGSKLISGSADNSIRIVEVPGTLGDEPSRIWAMMLYILLALLGVALAVGLRREW